MAQQEMQAVFIADDDEDDRFLLQLAFQEHSPECQLVFAEDGMVLIDTLFQSPFTPCLIVLDLNMPRLNGFEALTVLRSNSLYQHTPVVILTTSNSLSERQLAYELGANDFITKPMNLKLLGDIVREIRQHWRLDACL
ncbi:response regulator [Spirosoma aerolatum]|uniref:response regulator n=1 Tax=Spirosoma aerolatum TaxID=1211326 RepID=UPI0014757779|nr:response regulator [Spirosoma aerolatum]